MFYVNEMLIGVKILYKLKPLSQKKGQLTTLALKALDPATNRNNVRPVTAAVQRQISRELLVSVVAYAAHWTRGGDGGAGG